MTDLAHDLAAANPDATPDGLSPLPPSAPSQSGSDDQGSFAGGTHLDPDQDLFDDHRPHVGVDFSAIGQSARDDHESSADGTSLGPTNHLSSPTAAASGPVLPVDQCGIVDGDPSAAVQGSFASQPTRAGGAFSLPIDQAPRAAQAKIVDWEGPSAELIIYAKTLDELMKPRIACGNRLYQLEQFGLADTNAYKRMAALQEAIHSLEKDAVYSLEDAMKRHPLGPWVLSQKGVGLKTAGRLLAILCNPADRPNPAKLWAYCGYHVVNGAAPRRAKGEQANWNTDAKTLCFLVAEAMVKNKASAYRPVYDDGRAKYADAVHSTDCARCGICDGCGKPPGKNKQTHIEDTGCDDRRIRKASAGDPLKDGHKHARAMRLVSKAFLLDLWKEARRITNGQTS